MVSREQYGLGWWVGSHVYSLSSVLSLVNLIHQHCPLETDYNLSIISWLFGPLKYSMAVWQLKIFFHYLSIWFVLSLFLIRPLIIWHANLVKLASPCH